MNRQSSRERQRHDIIRVGDPPNSLFMFASSIKGRVRFLVNERHRPALEQYLSVELVQLGR